MAMHAARASRQRVSDGNSRLVIGVLLAALLVFAALCCAAGCSPRSEKMVTGDGYWTYPHTAQGRVLSYDASTCTAVVSLSPDSEVLLRYPDRPGKTLEPDWLFYSDRHYNGEDVVTLYCEDEAGGKYELPVGPLQRNAFVDVSMWLGRDGKGRLKCERIEVIDVSDVDSLFVRDFAEKCVTTGYVFANGSSWWQSPNRIPNRDFEKNIL